MNKVAKRIFETSSISPNGFCTEELREERLRKGFDVVTINRSRRAPLARKRLEYFQPDNPDLFQCLDNV